MGSVAPLAQGQNSDFPGVQKAMSPETYDAAGLGKLSPEERARLDEFIRAYVTKSSEKAATAAVDSAAKENKASAPEDPKQYRGAVYRLYRQQPFYA